MSFLKETIFHWFGSCTKDATLRLRSLFSGSKVLYSVIECQGCKGQFWFPTFFHEFYLGTLDGKLRQPSTREIHKVRPTSSYTTVQKPNYVKSWCSQTKYTQWRWISTGPHVGTQGHPFFIPTKGVYLEKKVLLRGTGIQD